jgi:hypothetical protein
MTQPLPGARRDRQQGRGFLWIAVIVLALLLAVYFALQVLAVLIRLALLVAVVLIAIAAFRAGKSSG